MASYGVEQDIPQGVIFTVGGTVALANPSQLSQQNTANSAAGQLLNSYAVVAANTTDTQASGTAVATQLVSVTATAAASVTLPVSVPGLAITIANTSAYTVKVYPNALGTGSEAINAGSANAAFSMATVTATTFFCTAAGQWWTAPKTAS